MADLYSRFLDSAMDIEALKKRSAQDAPRLASLAAELRVYLAKLKREWEETPISKRFNTGTHKGLLQGLGNFTDKQGTYYDDHLYYSVSLTEELHRALESLLDRLEKVSIATPQKELGELETALLTICNGMIAHAEWDFRTNAKRRFG